MKILKDGIALDEADLQEIFGLFASSTRYEKSQIYDPANRHFFKNENLSQDCTLSLEKREFAIDAWRAVLAFLNKRDCRLLVEGKPIGLGFIEDSFAGPGAISGNE